MQQNEDKPPAVLTKTILQVERRYSFVKTVYSLQELDDFRFENGCSFANLKKNSNFKQSILRCKRSSQLGKCPFSLLAWQPPKKGGNIEEVGEAILTVHVYAHSKHNHQLKSTADERSAHRLQKQIWSDTIAPVSSFSTPDGQKWTFLETVEHLVHQLDKLKQKFNCCRVKLKQMTTTTNGGRQKTICRKKLSCANRLHGCKFALLVQNTDQGRSHLYSTGKHTCRHKKRMSNAKRITMSLTPSEIKEINSEKNKKAEKEQKDVEKPPPPVLNRVSKDNVKRHYSYLKTVHSLQELDAVRIKHQCTFGHVQKNPSTFTKVQLHCQKLAHGRCQFGLLAWRPDNNKKDDDGDKIHVYARGEHNHVVRSADKHVMNRMPKNVLWPDANPPAEFTTPNGREWSLVETFEGAEEVNEWRKKLHCNGPPGGVAAIEKQSRTTMYCMHISRHHCAFQLLAQKTKQGHFHLYRSGAHICSHKEENVLPQNALLSDAHPPAGVALSGGQYWTFLKTTEPGKSLVDELDWIRRKYSCLCAQSRSLIKRRSVCRLQLYCTVRGAATRKCAFKLLVQRTDRNRYHIYKSGRGAVRMDEEEEDNDDDKEEEEEEQMDEKEEELEGKDDEQQDRIYEEVAGVDKEDEMYSEEDEMSEEELGLEENEDEIEIVERQNLDKEYEEVEKENEKKDFGMKEISESEEDQTDEEEEEEEDEEEEYDEKAKEDVEIDVDADEEKALRVANALRSRSPTVPHEINEVQFIEFVDHPKCEGMKMWRLGEPKKESETEALLITLDEEERANDRQKTKVPKWEIVKVEAHEQQSGPSNKDQQQQAAIGLLPMATINRQNHQPVVMARNRWWAEPAADEIPYTNRLLRERKHRINYRE